MQELYIGLMSGTSMDAVDAALVDFSQQMPRLIATHSQTLSYELRKNLGELCTPGTNEIDRMGELDVQMGELFAETTNQLLAKAKIKPDQVRAIGSHGQTIRHRPAVKHPFTLQIGDPNIIAERTGITTVADFRRRDMAVGGQGAPFAPAFHNHVFRAKDQDQIVLNIGGIANISWLPADLNAPVIGFDTGPGNTLLDAWINKQLEKPYDQDGSWAAGGKLNLELLDLLLADPYFQLNPPKSTGREYFTLAWLEKSSLQMKIPAQDIQATLCELTAISIAQAIDKLTSSARILACGGGVRNKYLMDRLKHHGANHQLHTTDEFGVPAQWMEAMLFAWLAQQTVQGKPSNLPSVTGAKKAVILGGIYTGR